MTKELTYATDEQLDMACEYLRQRAEQCPQEPVSIHEVLKEVGMEVTPAVDRVIDLIYQLWEDSRIHHVDSDWIEFIWWGDPR
jgi:hypothetical protein